LAAALMLGREVKESEQSFPVIIVATDAGA
jgi:hypothetical protein